MRKRRYRATNYALDITLAFLLGMLIGLVLGYFNVPELIAP